MVLSDMLFIQAQNYGRSNSKEKMSVFCKLSFITITVEPSSGEEIRASQVPRKGGVFTFQISSAFHQDLRMAGESVRNTQNFWMHFWMNHLTDGDNDHLQGHFPWPPPTWAASFAKPAAVLFWHPFYHQLPNNQSIHFFISLIGE